MRDRRERSCEHGQRRRVRDHAAAVRRRVQQRPGKGLDRLVDRLLQRVLGLAVGLERPPASGARGEHRRVLPRAVVVDAGRLPGRRDDVRHRRVRKRVRGAQRTGVQTGRSEDLRRDRHVPRLAVVRRAREREVLGSRGRPAELHAHTCLDGLGSGPERGVRQRVARRRDHRAGVVQHHQVAEMDALDDAAPRRFDDERLGAQRPTSSLAASMGGRPAARILRCVAATSYGTRCQRAVPSSRTR